MASLDSILNKHPCCGPSVAWRPERRVAEVDVGDDDVLKPGASERFSHDERLKLPKERVNLGREMHEVGEL